MKSRDLLETHFPDVFLGNHGPTVFPGDLGVKRDHIYWSLGGVLPQLTFEGFSSLDCSCFGYSSIN